jgi:hypothetical protein
MIHISSTSLPFFSTIAYLLPFGIEYLWALCRVADLLKDGSLACICSTYDENAKATGHLRISLDRGSSGEAVDVDSDGDVAPTRRLNYKHSLWKSIRPVAVCNRPNAS